MHRSYAPLAILEPSNNRTVGTLLILAVDGQRPCETERYLGKAHTIFNTHALCMLPCCHCNWHSLHQVQLLHQRWLRILRLLALPLLHLIKERLVEISGLEYLNMYNTSRGP